MATIALQVVTPEREVLSGDVDEVILPSVEGYMGVLPGHAPLLAGMDTGEVTYRRGKDRKFMAVSGGFVEVLGDSVRILADTAEPAEEIDLERAERARAAAEAALKDKASDQEMELAESKLKRALCRIDVRGRIGG